MTTEPTRSSPIVIIEVDIAGDDEIYLERLSQLLLAGGEAARLVRAKIETIFADDQDDEAEGRPPQ